MNIQNNKAKHQLPGHDNRGLVYDHHKYIERTIEPQYFDEIIELYKVYTRYSIDKLGIISTTLNRKGKFFRHPKLPISYPFEWTANMYKDAVILHLELFLKLDAYSLTLKDSLPNNILFDYYKPIFIDYYSLIKTKVLKNESWLVDDQQHYVDTRALVYTRMLDPYLIVPFIAIATGQYTLARTMLSTRACNVHSVAPTIDEVLHPSILSRTKYIIRKLFSLPMSETSQKIIIMKEYRKLTKLNKSVEFNSLIKRTLKFVRQYNMTPSSSDYVQYYKLKKEQFDFSKPKTWENKQKSVYQVFRMNKPKTVLDIGANTGWFSILSEHLGAEVISTDVDESSIDQLYLYAKEHKLHILPLVLSFNDFSTRIIGANNSSSPIFVPAISRLKSETVLCLGLIHHLVLGQGVSINEVVKILSKLTTKTLILEFVELKDQMIIEEPSFFSNLSSYSEKTWNINIVKQACLRYFNSCQIMPSNPDTRKLLILEK